MTQGRRFKRLVRARARSTGESYVSARRALLAKQGDPQMTTNQSPEPDLIEVELAGVATDDPTQTLIELRERGGDRRLAVVVGHREAAAIAFGLKGQPTARPMTHDALAQAITAFGGRIGRIVVGHRPETSTFTADVVVVLDDGSERHFDWRVSDAVAVAVRTDPPPQLLVPAALLVAPGG